VNGWIREPSANNIFVFEPSYDSDRISPGRSVPTRVILSRFGTSRADVMISGVRGVPFCENTNPARSMFCSTSGPLNIAQNLLLVDHRLPLNVGGKLYDAVAAKGAFRADPPIN